MWKETKFCVASGEPPTNVGGFAEDPTEGVKQHPTGGVELIEWNWEDRHTMTEREFADSIGSQTEWHFWLVSGWHPPSDLRNADSEDLDGNENKRP